MAINCEAQSAGCATVLSAPLEKGSDLQGSLDFGIEVGAGFGLSKGRLKNREAETRLQDVTILRFETAHLRKAFASMEPRRLDPHRSSLEGHQLRRHVLYRLKQDRWMAANFRQRP